MPRDRQLAVVIGKHKGKKVRVRYPSQMGGYIQFTFSSIMDAEEHVSKLSSWAKRRARFIDPKTGCIIKIP